MAQLNLYKIVRYERDALLTPDQLVRVLDYLMLDYTLGRAKLNITLDELYFYGK